MPDRPRRRAVKVALHDWQAAGLDRLDPESLVDHHVTVEGDDSGTTYRHVVEVPESLADLPRVGVWFALPPRFDMLRWYGRGPHENYPDRNRSAMLGVWSSAPDESPYLVPQEFGLRTDCRWFEASDSTSSEVLRIDVLPPAGDARLGDASHQQRSVRGDHGDRTASAATVSSCASTWLIAGSARRAVGPTCCRRTGSPPGDTSSPIVSAC